MEKREGNPVCYTGESAVRVNGLEIAHDAFGHRGDPPVLLIMGLSSQMVMWEDEFCERIAGRGFYVVRFDNRDSGRSTVLEDLGMPSFNGLFPGGPMGPPYTLADMARDTLGLMDALDLPSAHIVGASMGGMIAQVLAIDHPARVLSLTLIMTSSGHPFLPPPKPEAMQVLFKPIPIRRERFVEHFVETWRVLSGGQIPMESARIRRLGELCFERGVSPGGSARQLAAILASGSRKSMLASLRVPALVVHGDADPLLVKECGVDLAQSIPGSRLKMIKGMGHALPPAVWNDLITAIIRHIGPAAG